MMEVMVGRGGCVYTWLGPNEHLRASTLFILLLLLGTLLIRCICFSVCFGVVCFSVLPPHGGWENELKFSYYCFMTPQGLDTGEGLLIQEIEPIHPLNQT